MVENQNIKAIEVLSTAMQTMVDKKMNNVARDRTRVGMVTFANSNGTFNVLIDGREYNSIQAYGDGDIVANELVKVVYPDNNPTNMFILPKPSRRLATTTQSGWITATEKIKLNNILYDSDNALTITVGSGKDFTTLQGAINSLPKNLGCVDVTINVDAGTFAEHITIDGFFGSGSITINGVTVTGGASPTTLVNSIKLVANHCYIRINYIKTISSVIYSGTAKANIAIDLCRYVSLQYVFATATLSGSDDCCISGSGDALISLGTTTTLGTAPYGIILTSQTRCTTTGTVMFGTHSTAQVLAEYGSAYSGTDPLANYNSDYGGTIITSNGLMGSPITISGSSYGNIESGYVARYYGASGLVVMALRFNVTSSIATGSNITIASLADNTYSADTLTALSVFRSDTTLIKGYIATEAGGGDIVIRTDTALSSGTIYLSGIWKTKYS